MFEADHDSFLLLKVSFAIHRFAATISLGKIGIDFYSESEFHVFVMRNSYSSPKISHHIYQQHSVYDGDFLQELVYASFTHVTGATYANYAW